MSACRGHLDPRQSDLIETGSAAELSSRGPAYVMQTVAIYRTALEADTAWSRILAASIDDCMKQALRHIAVRPVDTSRLHPPVGRAGAAGYRVVGRFEEQGRTITMYFDPLIVRHGNTLTRLFLTSFQHPFSETFETSVARTVESRLLGAPLAA